MVRSSLRDTDPAPSPVPQPAPDGPDGPDAAAPESGAEPGTRSWRSPTRRAKQLFGAAAAVVALLVSLTALFDWFGGILEDPPPPPTIDGRIENVALQLQNDRLGDFLTEQDEPQTSYTPDELQEVGMRFGVRVRLQGLQGQDVPLKWQIYTDEGSRLTDPRFSQTIDLTPENQDQAASFPVWVPYPFRPGDYQIQFTLRDPEGKALGQSNLLPFTFEP